MKHRFITFEGLEGSGKTTQINLFKEYLIKNNKKVFITKEPGGTDLGLKLREILKKGNYNLSALTQFYLFLADREDHVEKVLKPILKNEPVTIILCDRYIDSTIAYQAFGNNLKDNKFFKFYMNEDNWPLIPDLTFLLYCHPEIGLSRHSTQENETDNFHKKDLNFHLKVKEGYEWLSLIYNKRISIINTINTDLPSNKSIEEIHQEIVNIYENKERNNVIYINKAEFVGSFKCGKCKQEYIGSGFVTTINNIPHCNTCIDKGKNLKFS
jgi:dTMP kinase